MKAEHRPLLLILMTASLTFACRSRNKVESENSKLAEVIINELENQDYTNYSFAMEQVDGEYKVPATTYPRGRQNLAVEVPVGTYRISLDYFKDADLILSTTFCKEGARNDVQTFVAGPNQVDVAVCNKASEPVAATVVIKPVLGASETFTIQNGKLVDPSGRVFIPRGINMPFAYYFDKSFQAIGHAKATGFNAVRVVWCADNYQDPEGRCQPKDFRPAAELDRVLTELTSQRLVAILNLQNATGQNTLEPLQLMIDYLIRADIQAVLMKHKKNLIINIANEWMGGWTKNRAWLEGYQGAIKQLRKAGLPHVLIVDARGYGQDFSSIEESAAELMELDGSILFSSHMYAIYNSEQLVQEKLNVIRTRKIPYVIGEFGCTHYDDATKTNKTVACEAILKETAQSAYPIGHLAWSYSGNREQEVDLDVFRSDDWKTLTSYGEKVVNGPHGVKATAKEACFFEPALCP
ncbi:glycoside hydrolase family 5 protein [Oligoflexus tunisiensis]|uniref:glycoside hydrolase family 5 protein n=1 Tax=Oligoflexus tunisiensis TaxID=708132 RepID=UPI00159F2407|nr:cellulase family glycosylhydrolase [Oligoflexus tunisiensis]